MRSDARTRLEEEVAALVADVPGVAYLSPRLLHRLTAGGRNGGGIRLSATAPATVEVWIAVRSGHRAATTARTVRERIAAALAGRPGLDGARVQVVVTALT
ncbi:hypothetical protein ACFV6F_01695 [Kitasatospora phosalacinea]|uniref:hypothetical protein n=1 Tax=Kitasatospora phosalacinea TaxID=2065 RepID=UPI00365EDFAD